jgi:hypothetical protein
MIELLLHYGFDTLDYSWVKAKIGMCTLADYSVAKKHQCICTDPVLTCFNNLKGLSLRGLASRYGPRALELANGLRLSTTVPNRDLSRAWVPIRG